jgi:hypothetical protein
MASNQADMASNQAESGKPDASAESKYDQAVRALMKDRSKGVPTEDEVEDTDAGDDQGTR